MNEYTRNEIANSIKKISLVLLSGILGIVVFINTSLIQQATYLQLEDVEIEMIISGINVFSFWLLINSMLFFVAMMPFEEIVCSIVMIFNPKCSTKFKIVEIGRLISFVLGTILFAVIFIIYMIKFSTVFI